MPSNHKISTAARNAGCNGVVDQVDVGAGTAVLEIFTGAPPANPAAVDTGTKLSTINLPNPAYGAATAGVASMLGTPLSDTNAAASGVAGHYREKDRDGNVVSQGTAGESADTPDLVFDNKNIVAGGTVTITSKTMNLPE